MKKLLYIFLILVSIKSFGQVPANDACANAQAIALPSSGNICINSSNLNATSDNSTNTCDVGAAGNEVWFTYVATGANNVITVTPNGVTPASGLVVTLISSGCSSGVYDICNSATGTNSVTSTLGLAPGTVVLISVETNGTDGDFQLCINSTPPSSNPGDGCPQATRVCDKSSISFPDLTGFTASGTTPSCFTGLFGPIPVRKDVWIKFTVGITGTLEFTGTVLGGGTEYDWALYNITSGCLGTEVSCDYDYSGSTTTFGMSSTTPTGTNFNAPITVTAGQTYALLLDNFSQNNIGFDLDWGGTFQMGTTALFSVTPQSSCTTPVTVTITNSSVGATTYTWNYGDGTTSTTNNATHTYTTTGDYLISLIANGGGCTSVYSQRVNLNAGPVITMSPLTSTICPPGTANLGSTISLGTPYNDRSFTNSPNLAITNNTAAGVTNTITSSGMINTTITTGVVQSICFTINHTKHADIGNDGLGNNVTITVNGNTYNFTPLPLPNVNGTATYCFPQSVLNSIMAAGGNANTPWVLKVADTRGGGGGTGSLVSWNIVLRDINSVTGYTWSPTATLTNTNTLNPIASPTATTVYSITATDLFGCSTTKTTTVTIACVCPTLTALSYGGPFCQSITAVTPTLTGSGAISSGSYSSTPAGLSINAGTGVLTPSLSTANTYTVTYLIAATASCSAISVNTVVTINATPTISVNSPTICSGTSTVLTASGGTTYSWSPGTNLSATTGSTVTANPTVTTIYTITGTTSGCSATSTSTLTVNPIPTTTASASSNITCLTPTITLSSSLAGANYTWTAPAGGILGSANSQTTTATGAGGTYSLFVASAAGCSYLTTVSVTQNTLAPTGVSAGSNQTLTCASSSVTLTGSVTTPTNPSINWAGTSVCGTATTIVTSACGAGIYTVTATNPANGCVQTATVQVFPSAGAPTVTNNPVTNTITCTNTLVTVSITTTATPVSYTWTGTGIIGASNTSSISVSQGGTFQYTVTNTSSGCSTSNSQVVIQNTTVPTTTASTTGTLTCSTTTVALSSTLAGMNYTWTAPSGGSVGNANAQNTTASGTAGTYSLIVMDPSNGCSYNTITSVIQNTAVPTTTASASGMLTCTTLTVDLNSTLAGMNYTWTAPATGTVVSVNTQSTSINGAGDYTLTVIDPSNGCTFTTTATVTQNTVAPIGVSAGSSQTLSCSASSSVTLNGSVATPTNVMVDWGTGVCGTQTTVVTEACAAGVYTLTATNPSNGCVATSTVEVFPNAGAPTVTISSTALTIDCINATQSVTVTSTPGTDVVFHWNNTPASASADSSTATFSNANTYICTVTNTISGCSTPVQVVVTTNTAVPTTSVNVTGMLTCTTLTVDLIATIPGMNYTWTAPPTGFCGSPNTGTTSVNGPGDYTLTVVDPSNGCSFSTTVAVTQNTIAPIGVSAGSNQTLTCAASSSVTLSGSVTSPTNVVVDWGTGVCGTQTTMVTSACAAGVYTLTATDPANGCIATSTVEVFPNAGAPTVSISATALTIDCNNATQSVTVTSTPSTDVLYHWNNTPASASTDSSMATFNNAGTYICTVTNTLSGCSAPVQVVVTTNTTVPALTITGTQTLTCATPTAAISLTTTPVSGLTYTWAGTLVSGQGTNGIVVNQPNIYTVTVTDAANGCTNTATSAVMSDTNVPVATISATSSNSIISCQSPSVTLTASVTPSGTYSYTWTPSGGNNASATVNSPNVYSVQVLNQASGCLTSAQYTVTGNTTPPVAVVSDATISCGSTSTPIGGAVTTATNASYNWSTSGTGTILGGSTSTPTVNAAGAYVVTVTDNDNGCTNTATVNVSQTSVIAAFAANPTSGTAPLDVNFTNQSTGATAYSWDFGDITSLNNTSVATNPAHTYNTIGTYTVILTASNGACTSTVSISIEVLENSSIIVPNVFTPNGDGKNDLFKITSTGIEELNCGIFNRWGQKLHTINVVDGSWNGGSAPDGTYFYILTAKGYDGKEFKQEGFISLFK